MSGPGKCKPSSDKLVGIKNGLRFRFVFVCFILAAPIAVIAFYNHYYFPTQEVLLFETALLGAVAAAAIIAFFKLIYKPASQMEAVMRLLIDADMHLGHPGDQNGKNIGSVTQNLQNIILQQYSAKMMKKQAELNALQSQINPHFLYNTLESIRGQAIVNKTRSIEMMTKALADMFRYSISKKGTMISFREELTNIDNYLMIQQYRFNNKFTIEKKVDEDTLDNEIPKLLIQPIVENALQHGLEMKRGKGKISITAYCTEQHFIVSIKDDGLGIELKKLKEINNMLTSTQPAQSFSAGTHASIGLSNVNERIKITFGPDCGVNVSSAEGIGTEVELVLGIIKKKAETA